MIFSIKIDDNIDNMSAFTDRIEKLLTEKKISKIEFCEKIALPKQSLYDWKKRNTIPAADIALKIAQYLNTTVEYLVNGTESNPLQEEVTTLKEKIEQAKKILG